MKTSYLEYSKQILTKVSFDQTLFEKELRKAIKDLLEAEIRELQHWCTELFGSEHRHIIHQCFSAV